MKSTGTQNKTHGTYEALIACGKLLLWQRQSYILGPCNAHVYNWSKYVRTHDIMTGRHGLNNKTYQQRDAREEGFGVFAFSSRLFPQHEELESSLSLKEAQENAA